MTHAEILADRKARLSKLRWERRLRVPKLLLDLMTYAVLYALCVTACRARRLLARQPEVARHD